MRRIEDIKLVKKRTQEKAPLESPSFSAEEFLAEAPSPPVIEPELSVPEFPVDKKSRRRFPFGWVLFFLIVIAITAFCGFELVKAKAKISSNISGLNSDFSDLTDSISKKDFAAIDGKIETLNSSTTSALLTLQSVGQDVYVLNLLYPKGKSSNITGMVDSARSAHLLTSSFKKVFDINFSKSTGGGTSYLDSINGYLSGIGNYLRLAPTNLKDASFSGHLAKSMTAGLDPLTFPASEQKSVKNLQKFSTTSSDFFDYLSNTSGDLSSALALNGGKKSYLILFLNNAELRPGGGFIGSFARLDLENGRATKLDFEKNIYTLDKSFITAGNNIEPPPEYKTITNAWSMKDSNVYGDFEESAKKVAWFYQQETGNSVDGVFALDTTLFRNLLKSTGPINMPEYNLVVTDQNFLSDVQYQVEIGYYKDQTNWAENQPKKILADMMPKFLSAMTKNSRTEKSIAQDLFRGVSEKHLLAFSANSNIEDLIDGIGASGKIHDSSGDYLYLSDANIGGMKSSLNIAETVSQNVEIKDGGSVAEKISIKREHKGSLAWPDGVNNNFLKIYLPLAAKVDEVKFVSGNFSPMSDPAIPQPAPYSVGTQNGKSFVSFWQNTKPGESSESQVSFVRNMAVNFSSDSFDWQITVQKQPGVESYNWNLYLVYPKGWKPQNVEGYDAKKRQIYLSEVISKDSVFRLRFIRD